MNPNHHNPDAGFRFLQGARLYLRAPLEADCDGAYPEWLNDEEVCAGNSHHLYPYSRDSARAYLRAAQDDKSQLMLAIILNDGSRHIGNIALQQIHPTYRSAELSILLGDKSAWGQGYGLEAAILLCNHGFAALNLHRIGCGTFSNNRAMQKMALALGMQQEGIRRQAAFKRGSYLDIIEYGVLTSEYPHLTPAKEPT